MTTLDDQRTVLLLACQVEGRSDAEQDALLRVAARADAAANAATGTDHRRGPAWRLYRHAEATRALADGDRPRADPRVLAKLDAQADRWDASTRSGDGDTNA